VIFVAAGLGMAVFGLGFGVSILDGKRDARSQSRVGVCAVKAVKQGGNRDEDGHR
jgi:hypothetical protein